MTLHTKMNCKFLFTLIILFFPLTKVFGQNKFYLEHKCKPGKTKFLDLERIDFIKTYNSTYRQKRIVGFTDSTISITERIKTEKDTIYSYTYKINYTNNFKTTTYKQPIYRTDTIIIAFADIHLLKKDWFNNRVWLTPFAMVAFGAALGIVALPFALGNGSERFKNWVEFETILIGVSAPPIFIGSRKSRYDLKNKWNLKKGK